MEIVTALFFYIMYIQIKWIIENVGWEVSPFVVELDLGRTKCLLAVDLYKRRGKKSLSLVAVLCGSTVLYVCS